MMNGAVRRMKEAGYNPVHFFGDWWFCRIHSCIEKRFSFYTIRKIKPCGFLVIKKRG